MIKVTSMIGSISDVLTRIGAIEQQVQSLQTGTLLDSALGVSGGGSTSASGSTASGDFANQLVAAQNDGTTADASTAAGSSFGSLGSSALAGGGLNGTAASGLYAAGATGTSSLTSPGTSSLTSSGTSSLTSAGTSSPAGTSSLSPSASRQLTASQQQFASTLSADTGLNPNVVSAWLLAEESGGAAQSRQAAGNNDWLNIGYTDSGTYGSSDSVWSDPTTAANATATWLQGQDSIPGYGTASSGIQSILSTVGQTPAAQIQAIQSSGWSSGGYPSLGSLYEQVTGSTSSIGGTTL
ncbi:MAG: hypothetical protein ACRDLT_17915 [Solirubrobacteraceae bacterium]